MQALNLNTAYNPSNLVLSFAGGQAAAQSLATGRNRCKLDGGGDAATIVKTPQPPGATVPEPQSWMLFGTVAAGLTFAVRRRKQTT